MEKESSILNLVQMVYGHGNRRLSSSSDDDKDKTAEITFQIIFYGLFVAMLVAFWFVFKRGQKNNWEPA